MYLTNKTNVQMRQTFLRLYVCATSMNFWNKYFLRIHNNCITQIINQNFIASNLNFGSITLTPFCILYQLYEHEATMRRKSKKLLGDFLSIKIFYLFLASKKT